MKYHGNTHDFIWLEVEGCKLLMVAAHPGIEDSHRCFGGGYGLVVGGDDLWMIAGGCLERA